MIYVHAEFDNGYRTGCEDNYYEFTDEVTAEEIEQTIREDANEYFANWEYLATGWDSGFDSDEDEQEYYDGCSYSWEYITEEEYNDAQ